MGWKKVGGLPLLQKYSMPSQLKFSGSKSAPKFSSVENSSLATSSLSSETHSSSSSSRPSSRGPVREKNRAMRRGAGRRKRQKKKKYPLNEHCKFVKGSENHLNTVSVVDLLKLPCLNQRSLQRAELGSEVKFKRRMKYL